MKFNAFQAFATVALVFMASRAQLHAQAGDSDPTFNANIAGSIRFSFGVYAIGRQNDGRILIGGGFTEVNGFSRIGLARLNPDGALDTTFDPGAGAENTVLHIVIQPDGKILVGGIFTTFSGSGGGLTRLNPDGSRDTNFSSGPFPAAYALTYHPSGKIYIADGDYVRRLNLDGTIDETFSMTLPEEGFHGLPSWVGDFRVQPDGRILMSGNFWQVNGQDRDGLARLNQDGTLDPTFFPGAPEAEVVGLAPDGRIYLAGLTLQRFHADGTFDDTFGYNLYGEFFDCIDVQQDGKPLVGGNFHLERELLARFNLDGTIDHNFSGYVDGQVEAIVVQPDGRILIGGGFSHVNGEPHTGIARLLGDTPVLGTQRAGAGQLVLSWPSAYTNYALENATTLSSSNWSSVTNPVVALTDGLNCVTNPITTTGSRFFRLMRP